MDYRPQGTYLFGQFCPRWRPNRWPWPRWGWSWMPLCKNDIHITILTSYDTMIYIISIYTDTMGKPQPFSFRGYHFDWLKTFFLFIFAFRGDPGDPPVLTRYGGRLKKRPQRIHRFPADFILQCIPGDWSPRRLCRRKNLDGEKSWAITGAGKKDSSFRTILRPYGCLRSQAISGT